MKVGLLGYIKKLRSYIKPKSALKQFQSWIEEETWFDVLSAKSSHEKAEIFQNKLKNKLDKYCPQKVIKFTSDDKPWFSDKLKRIVRKKKRE